MKKPVLPRISVLQTGLSRREFLKMAALGVGGLSFSGIYRLFSAVDFPQADHLGRVCVSKVDVYSRPDDSSPTVGALYEDSVVPLLKEVVGHRPLHFNQRFIQIPDGYVYAPYVQPVRNQPNIPVTILPAAGGMWVEVTQPYADILVVNPPARGFWIKNVAKPRVYYSQVLWVDNIKIDDQKRSWYRVNERYGSPGDIFWVAGEAMRPLTQEDLSPISPDVTDKKVVVDVTRQTMACYEGKTEVYYCRVSTGAKYDAAGNPVDKWSTPVGPHPIWRKLISIHMAAGSSGAGYDLPGIGWTSLFTPEGVAVHSTFWHNNFGVPMSHGCVNARPEDSKWVFRWTIPTIDYEPGDQTISGDGSTRVIVIES